MIGREILQGAIQNIESDDPLTNEPLTWTWGVDFFHACEYVTKIANAIFGTNTVEAKEWASEHRRILRDEVNGVSSVIRSAAQQRRRNGLKADLEDYTKAVNYLRNYRANMDYAERRAKNEPIGSGITEAGCKVIFNQRLKQSGMKWYRETFRPHSLSQSLFRKVPQRSTVTSAADSGATQTTYRFDRHAKLLAGCLRRFSTPT